MYLDQIANLQGLNGCEELLRNLALQEAYFSIGDASVILQVLADNLDLNFQEEVPDV